MGLFTTNKNTDNAEDVFHFPTSKKLLLIFTRNPELGKCKTRLAAKIGNEAALEIYVFLLKHTAKITQKVISDKYVYYSEEIKDNAIWNDPAFHKRLQKGNDLGERMAAAFEQGFKDGYEKIIIIGSDMYDLTTEELDRAFEALNENDFVIGPATDGGYYLLGMKKRKPQLFQDKLWGTSTVLQSTLTQLASEKWVLLSEKNDIDVFEDIKNIEIFQPFIKKVTND
ncbi:MAG: TIGR04282 family arsenosugar biosynthesis glycosyltransferase [Flavobacteriaceae bacterium]